MAELGGGMFGCRGPCSADVKADGGGTADVKADGGGTLGMLGLRGLRERRRADDDALPRAPIAAVATTADSKASLAAASPLVWSASLSTMIIESCRRVYHHNNGATASLSGATDYMIRFSCIDSP